VQIVKIDGTFLQSALTTLSKQDESLSISAQSPISRRPIKSDHRYRGSVIGRLPVRGRSSRHTRPQRFLPSPSRYRQRPRAEKRGASSKHDCFLFQNTSTNAMTGSADAAGPLRVSQRRPLACRGRSSVPVPGGVMYMRLTWPRMHQAEKKMRQANPLF
jgi:hypothetical protein